MTGKQIHEESRYRTLFEVANDSIFILKDYRFVECNRMALKMFGCERGNDILYSYLWDFSPRNQPDGRVSKEKAIELMDDSLGGKPQRFYWKHIRKDGREFDAEISFNLLVTEGENSLLAIARDITKQKRAEQALRESEEKGRLLIENIPSVSWITNEHGKTTFISPAVEKIYGFSQKEILEKGEALWFGRVHNDDIDKVKESFESMFTEGMKFDVEYRIQGKDGKWIWAHDTAIMAYEEDGVKCAYGIFTDITEHKRVEEALRESEKIFSLFMEHSPIYVFFKDENIRSIRLSRNYEQMLGRPIDELLGRTMDELFPSELAKNMIADDLHILNEGIPRTVEEEFNGRFYETTKFPILINGKPKYLAGYTIDITERKRAEEALRDSEKKYRDLFEDAPVGYMEYDSKGIIKRVNRRGLEMLGYEAEEMVGEPACNFVTEREKARELINAKLAGDIPPSRDLERTCLRKDGTTFPCLIEDEIFKDKTGQIIGSRSTFQDITERKRTDEEQKRLQAQLANALEIAHLGPWEYDVADDLFTFNDYFYKIFRTTAEEVGGYTISSADYAGRFVHPDEIAVVGEGIRKAIETDDPNFSRQLEHRILYADGTEGHITVRFFIVKDAQGKTIKTYGVNQDITEQKMAGERLRESEEKLARSKKMESLGLLAGGVAHDLNNVLAGIVSYPELLLLDLPEDSKYRKPIQTIHESGNRAVAIVQDLLTIARGVASTKETLNLNDIVREYLTSPEFKRLEQYYSTVRVKVDLDIGLLNINGSPVHLRKVIMNLVSNASEAIEGAGNIIISTMNRYVDRPIRGYEDVNIGEYAVLTVSDDGSGITSGDLERIFEPFYTKKVMGRSGTGLGLAVVWNIMQDHKGYIDVASSEDGTTFEMYFPVTRDKLPVKDLAKSIEDYRGGGETILVVDDIESQREISCSMLNVLGYKTIAVSSGEEALEYLKENQVDLILLDMIMDPGINGRETYERIIKIRPNQKAVIVSGFAETDEVKKAQRMGAGQYIKKPLTLQKIGLSIKEELKATKGS